MHGADAGRGDAAMTLRDRMLYLLCALVPKRNTAAVHTWPAFDDTALALIPALEKSRLDKIYYLAAGDVVAGSAPAWGGKVEVLPKRSLRALWAFLTSRYVFFTHQCFTQVFPRNVVSVHVWHGMPIKKVGWMLPGSPAPRAQYDLATSDFWVPIIRACMKPWGQVLVNGLPRCDRFGVFGHEGVRARLPGLAKPYAKLAVWLPTYRQAMIGGKRKDGQDFENAAQMAGFDADRFETWLARRNMLCVLKPHPLGPRPQLRDSGYLRVMDDAALAARGLTLYGLLGGADVLLTDVSSVYVDFLVMDKPIVHAFADRREYESGRGFTFEWTDDFFGGPMVDDMAGVERALDDVAAGRDSHAENRRRLRKLFHAETSSSAAAALLNHIGLGGGGGGAKD